MKTNPLSLLIIALFSCLSLLPIVKAVTPAPDGGYPGGNTAEGQAALLGFSTGGFNTAIGYLTLRSNTVGNYNTALGAGALVLNTADGNTATGVGALLNNTTGTFNTGNGVFALFNNSGGDFNTGMGSFVLYNNTTGTRNMAMGDSALLSNTTGSRNVAIGVSALRNSNGTDNIAIGQDALVQNASGSFNVAIGGAALSNNNSATSNTAIGFNAGSNITGFGNICIGYHVGGVLGESLVIRIGDNFPTQAGVSACYIGGIWGQTVNPATGGPVYVDSSGKLGTLVSSQRFKHDIEPMDHASEAILALKPVTFHYKNDTKNTPCFGLIAEEVAKVDPALVVRDQEGQPYSVRYEAADAMLLNEFLKEHRKNEEQGATIARLIANDTRQQKEIEALTAGLQRVSAELELSRSAPRAVLNDK